MIRAHRYILGSVILVLCMLSAGMSAHADFGDFQKEQSLIGMDLYKNVYENYDVLAQDTALSRTLEKISTRPGSLAYSKADLTDLLRGDINAVIQKFIARGFTSVSQDMLQNELNNTIRPVFEFEKNMADYELSLQMETGSMGLYSNGTLDDSDFDLVVDLNIIDVIYFGEQAKLPVAYWGSRMGSGFTGAGPENQNQNGSTAGNNNGNGSQNRNTNANAGQNQNGNTSSPNNNRNAGAANQNTNAAVCLDPGSLNLQDPDLIDQIRREMENIDQGTSAGNGNTNAFIRAGNPALTADENGYAKMKDNPAGDSGYSVDRDEEGSPEWPCNSHFCILISARKGVGQSSYAKEDNSIMAHASYIHQYLDNLGKYSLAQKCTTRQFWGIGFNDIQLSDFLHLDVVVSSKPVYSPKKHRYQSDDPAKIRQDVSAEWAQLIRSLDLVPDSTAAEKILNGSIAGMDQETVTANLSEYLQQLTRLEQEQTSASQITQRLNNHTEDLGPLLEQAAMMKNALQSILDTFQDGKSGILKSSRELEQKPRTK